MSAGKRVKQAFFRLHPSKGTKSPKFLSDFREPHHAECLACLLIFGIGCDIIYILLLIMKIV